jgi:hypothetical protein
LAKTVYDITEITLQGGKDVVLKPLPIGLLKKLMTVWKTIGDAETEDDIFNVYLEASGICLSREFKDDFEKPIETDKDGNLSLSDDYRQHLEEILDLPTIFEVLDKCGGLKLNDENLAAAAAAAEAEATLGTT